MHKAFYSFDDFKKSGFYSKWWRKYLSKCKLIKRSCSWRETYCVMNIEQKSKNIFKYCILNNEDQLNTAHGRLGWKYFKKKTTLTRLREEGTFSQNEISFHQNKKTPSHLLTCKLPRQFVSWTSTKTKIPNCIVFFLQYQP